MPEEMRREEKQTAGDCHGQAPAHTRAKSPSLVLNGE